MSLGAFLGVVSALGPLIAEQKAKQEQERRVEDHWLDMIRKDREQKRKQEAEMLLCKPDYRICL